MDTKKLRQKILDLAIHGKLVPQDPNDEPASVLLERIRAEKEQLIKEGKIKAPKKSKSAGDTFHYQHQMPWELPEGWVWSTLGDFLNLQAGKFIQASDIHDKSPQYPYPCYGGNGIRGFVSSYNRMGSFPIVGRQGALCGNINYASGKFYATEHAVVVETYGGTNVDWARYLLEGLNLNQYATATAQPGLSVKTINEVPIPIPPVKEQSRIAVCLQASLESVEQIEELTTSLCFSVSETKSKILDLAIHGKLVPQDPSDEPAIELLKRINPDFKPSDNLHYADRFPTGWAEFPLYAICEILDSQRKPVNSKEREKRVEKAKTLYPYYGATGQVGLIDNYILDGDYLLLGEDGAPFLDRYANKAYSVSGRIWVNNHAHILKPRINPTYMMYYLNAIQYRPYVTGTTRLKLTQEVMRNIPVLVPPLAEQARIISRVEQLFRVIDAIQLDK